MQLQLNKKNQPCDESVPLKSQLPYICHMMNFFDLITIAYYEALSFT